jgi:hypothetical protein
MLTKSEKLVWAAAFVHQLAKSDAGDAVQAAYRAVTAMRLVTLTANERDWEPSKMLNSMREMKP